MMMMIIGLYFRRSVTREHGRHARSPFIRRETEEETYTLEVDSKEDRGKCSRWRGYREREKDRKTE